VPVYQWEADPGARYNLDEREGKFGPARGGLSFLCKPQHNPAGEMAEFLSGMDKIVDGEVTKYMEVTPGETAVVIHPELPLEEIISVDPLDPQAESVDPWISGVLFPEDPDELPDYNRV